MNPQESQQEKSVTETERDHDDAPAQGEFKVVVRKLEMPVRPRGVLAE